MQISADAVLEAARGWVGTRFHHQGRRKRTGTHPGGVDCLGLLVGMAAELDLRNAAGVPLAALDNAEYGHFPDGAALIAALEANAQRIETHEARDADILLFTLEHTPRHLGIYSTLGGVSHLIHAYAQARKVVEQPLDAWWRARVFAAYRIV